MKRFLIFILISSIIQVALFSQSCLPDGIELLTQAQIDSFQINYPNCTEIEGYVLIGDADITSLNGLNVLTSIGGTLDIFGCIELTDLAGLEGLSHIGGTLNIVYNDSLTSLTSLSGLTTIGGDLKIISNYTLTSLAGLENIEPNTIENLAIFWNHSLSACEVASICYYILNPSAFIIDIYDNDTGCNSQTEVEEACESLCISEYNILSNIELKPNPARYFSIISFNILEGDIISLSLLNRNGQEIKCVYSGYKDPGKYQFDIDCSNLTKGIYLIKLQSGMEIITKKLIVH